MEKKKLRIGLLLDGYNTSAWMYKIIEKIQQSYYAEIALAVINNNALKTATLSANRGLLNKIKNNRGRLFYLAIRKALEVIYSLLIERRTYLPDAFKKMDLTYILNDIPAIKVRPIQKGFFDRLHENDINLVKSYNVDIFIRAGFKLLSGEILNSSKYGIWSFHHGDNYVNRGGPAGFWESMENWPETGSILQILTEDLDNGIVLYRSFSCTNAFSVKDNRNNYFWKSLSFMTRKIEELYNKGEKEFFQEVDNYNQHPLFYSNRLYVKPTNSELAKLTFFKIFKKMEILFNNKFTFGQWILMFDLKSEFSSSLWRYKKIIPPKDRFWADPHAIYKNNMYYIFIEEYLYKLKKGHISVIIMDESGKHKEPVKILDKLYHISYPFIFEHENEYYMIPETLSNNTIELYKCIGFPYCWEWKMNLMEDIKALDATLLYHRDKWWMFVNIIENEGASGDDELFLFYSENLFTNKWKSHPRNPIVSDCKTARPAGKIFEKDGRLYRPSQNCSVGYGFGFNISHIELLDEYNYKEKVVSMVKPNWSKNIFATHTFNRVNSLHIIDAVIKRRK